MKQTTVEFVPEWDAILLRTLRACGAFALLVDHVRPIKFDVSARYFSVWAWGRPVVEASLCFDGEIDYTSYRVFGREIASQWFQSCLVFGRWWL